MSVDPYLRGCSDCGEDEMSCGCFGSHCEYCHDRSHDLKETEHNGWLCEVCIDELIAGCHCCGQEIFIPECYIVTRIKDGRKKESLFCGDECAREQQECEFRKEWV